ncbi:MAG: toxic anion resistance protein [Eubacteriales bacterium]
MTNDMKPSLSFGTPETTEPAPVVTPDLAPVAPAAPTAPSLTLTPDLAPTGTVIPEQRDVTTSEESILSPEELAEVENFAKQINVADSAMILQYGASTQKDVASFSESTLQSVRTKDLGAVGDNLTALMKELKQFGTEDQEEAKGIKGFFKKKADAIETMRAGYATAEANVDKISKELEAHQVVLMKDIAMFDQLYDLNTKYYKELTMYILAGKKALVSAREGKLKELEAKAKASSLPQDAQEFNDFANLCSRFEKKLHDLDLTRMISIQMGPQTRLLQNNNTLMVEKLQSSLVNTIPLWKSQMVIAMGLEHSAQAAHAQKAVTDMTNQMLKQNADALKMNTINTAREMERSIVDIDTLKHTNQQLISTLDEVLNIQQEGAAQRRQAEAELGKIEGELRQKLLEIRDGSR